jgi:hypothetical protein
VLVTLERRTLVALFWCALSPVAMSIIYTITIHSLQEPRKNSKYPTLHRAELEMAVDWLLASHSVPL